MPPLLFLLLQLLTLLNLSSSFIITTPFKAGATKSKFKLHQKFATFDDFLQNYPEPVLVDFYATWCGPCQLMSRELKKLSDDVSLKGVLKIAKLDTDKFPALGTKYGVEGLPTCMLFKNGKVVKTFVGVVPAEQILYELTPHITRKPNPHT
ncbi:hypothetical protein ScalyP_jg6280 [Parmales sp. scaly parma]|jgi:thioredoxin|nr:hypothetical protein ScalyP_jg6280 [Parmales sp. scaly parma]|tara:strand:+ start:232 stop:684 length:453 start_codon:yes stop_codon:yes gene_type:complete